MFEKVNYGDDRWNQEEWKVTVGSVSEDTLHAVGVVVEPTQNTSESQRTLYKYPTTITTTSSSGGGRGDRSSCLPRGPNSFLFSVLFHFHLIDLNVG